MKLIYSYSVLHNIIGDAGQDMWNNSQSTVWLFHCLPLSCNLSPTPRRVLVFKMFAFIKNNMVTNFMFEQRTCIRYWIVLSPLKNAECLKDVGYCSAWAKTPVFGPSLGPKQNTIFTVLPTHHHHHPPTENFLKGSRHTRRLRFDT